MELLQANPDAFVLAYVIAYRAQWSTRFNRHGLELGEAFVGDHDAYGMTERRYRTAKDNLAKWGFATFKPTNKGTVATLTDTRLFDVLASADDEQGDTRPTGRRRAGDEQPTTTKNIRRKEGKKGNPASRLLLEAIR
jgi:hypothetical protein